MAAEVLSRSAWKALFFAAILVLSAFVDSASSAAKSKKAKRPKTSKKDVLQRGLIDRHPGPSSIIHEHDRYCARTHQKNFAGTTLAYVTPWNQRGYEVAKTFNRKFTYVAPTWYRIQPSEKAFTLVGSHDVDLPWVHAVRTSNNNTGRHPRIVPRFMLENWSLEGLGTMLVDTGGSSERLLRTILNECRQNSYDGLVLDMGAMGMRMPERIQERALAAFLKSLGGELHKQGNDFILVVPPVKGPSQSVAFASADFMELQPFVDHFSLSTYDYSLGMPGPNAPLSWSQQAALALVPPDQRSDTMLTHKLLMGVPMYGYEYSPEEDGSFRVNAVLGPQFVNLLKEHHPQISWDDSVHEHHFAYSRDHQMHTVYYPSLQFLDSRLKAASEAGIGIAVWELGQGLDYFYDLL